MKRILLILPLLVSSVLAKPIPAGLFADHGVLQRDRPVPIWGTADSQEKVTVSFAAKEYTVTADADGRWKIFLDPMPASSESRDLAIRGATGEPMILRDMLVGEVWIASGQSNMEMSLYGCANMAAEIAEAKYPLIRHFYVPHGSSVKAVAAVKGKWSVCSPTTAGAFTGVGYFFARNLYQKLGVPVGLIHSSFGGTPAEAWTSREALGTVPELKARAEEKIAIMEKIPAALEAFPKDIAAWEEANGLLDQSNEGLKNGWAAPDFDDATWITATTPFNLEIALKSKTGGVFWIRKAVDLPPEKAGKGFNLGLGFLAEQYDTVYFNGVEVASRGKTAPDFYTCFRGCFIPATLVKAGRNVIAIRYVSHTEKGAFYAPGSQMQIPVADGKSVDNTWKIAFERAFPPVTPAALAGRPKVPALKMQNGPTALFNAMINPLIPYAIRGVIWYQGESNTSDIGPGNCPASLYFKLFSVLIGDWRARWGQGDFPFYFVQLANNDPVTRDHRETSWGVLREAQSQALAGIPNTGMAVAIDIGSALTIHPTNKQDVGNRLALWARAKTYGEKDLVFQSPIYQSHGVENGKMRVRFNTGGSPLMIGKKAGLEPVVETPSAKLDWFEIAGADGKFVWADAVIEGADTVVVSSPEVPAPTQVRYAWAINPQGCNLYNKEGLPASPFRTNPPVPLAHASLSALLCCRAPRLDGPETAATAQ